MNAAYRATIERIARTTGMDPKVRREWQRVFRDAQRKWLAFRDADCNGAVAYEWFGGTGVTAAILGCKTEKTVARAKELRDRNER